MGAFYHIIVILVAGISVIAGFRRGLVCQISGVLGMAFGCVLTRVFGSDLAGLFSGLFTGLQGEFGGLFSCRVMAASLIYVVVFILFSLLSVLIRSAMSVFPQGILNAILGSFFMLWSNLVFLSIAFTLIICSDHESGLLKCAEADDGNVVECVLSIAPAMLGCPGSEEMLHLLQLREARKISENLKTNHIVITDRERADKEFSSILLS